MPDRPEIIVTSTQNLMLTEPNGTDTSIVQVQFVGTGWTGTVNVKHKVRGAPDTWYAASYFKDHADNTMKSATFTNADGFIEVDTSGMDVRLEIARTAGTLTVRHAPRIAR